MKMGICILMIMKDYEGYDDLLGKAMKDVDSEDKYIRCWKCGLE